VSKIDCTTVGYVSRTGTGLGNLATSDHWNGTRWTMQPNKLATPYDAVLHAIACTSSTSCNAVGENNGGGSTGVGFAEHWNGTTWQPQPTQ
jgi:hypothetical protein